MAEGHGEGQVAVIEYRDEPEGEVPYLMLIKEALNEEKQWFMLIMWLLCSSYFDHKLSAVLSILLSTFKKLWKIVKIFVHAFVSDVVFMK